MTLFEKKKKTLKKTNEKKKIKKTRNKKNSKRIIIKYLIVSVSRNGTYNNNNNNSLIITKSDLNKVSVRSFRATLDRRRVSFLSRKMLISKKVPTHTQRDYELWPDYRVII